MTDMAYGHGFATTDQVPVHEHFKGVGAYGFLDTNPGFWILTCDPECGKVAGPCDDADPSGCEAHDFHCVMCWRGTTPDGCSVELRETFPVDADHRAEQREHPSSGPDIWGPLGDGYELCRACLSILEGVL